MVGNGRGYRSRKGADCFAGASLVCITNGPFLNIVVAMDLKKMLETILAVYAHMSSIGLFISSKDPLLATLCF